MNKPLKIPKVGDYHKELTFKRTIGSKKERYQECMVTHSKPCNFMDEIIYNVGIKTKGAEKTMPCIWSGRSGFII